jgi:hypothetical protein
LVEGRERVLAEFRKLFAGAAHLHLTLKRNWISAQGGVGREFGLVITDANGGQTLVEGIDLFAFRGGRISGIRAYVEARGDGPAATGNSPDGNAILPTS